MAVLLGLILRRVSLGVAKSKLKLLLVLTLKKAEDTLKGSTKETNEFKIANFMKEEC
jgi:deoxyinosine 3'endonuclease (endonuclease V)